MKNSWIPRRKRERKVISLCVCFQAIFLSKMRTEDDHQNLVEKGKKLAVSNLLHVKFLKGIFQKTTIFEWSLFFFIF
jgi:hypothetical protein